MIITLIIIIAATIIIINKLNTPFEAMREARKKNRMLLSGCFHTCDYQVNIIFFEL